jgi:hypothetical protein
MSLLQLRLPKDQGGDGRWYNPNRDIAYCWQYLVKRAASVLEDAAQEPWLRSYLDHYQVTLDDLGEGIAVYVRYMVYAHTPSIQGLPQALEQSGWYKLAPAVQGAVLMALGQVMTCAFYPAIRDVYFPNETEKPLDEQALFAAVSFFKDSVSRPPLRLRLARVWRYLRSRCSRFFRLLRSLAFWRSRSR